MTLRTLIRELNEFPSQHRVYVKDNVLHIGNAYIFSLPVQPKIECDAKADALIAAAPLLLEACEKALRYFEECVEPTCDEDRQTLEADLLRKAIKAAQ